MYLFRRVRRQRKARQADQSILCVELLEDRTVPSLVAAFDFGEAGGMTVLDASGNGISGTISGATRTAAGKYGAALAFNGANSWVTVPDVSSLHLTTAMTLEAWVQPTAASTDWTAVLLKERAGGLAYALYAADGAGQPPAGYVNRDGGDVKAAGSAMLPLNAWSHLAVTYDGAAIRLYVNGTQVGSKSQTGSIAISTGPLRIGGDAVWGEYFTGLIDEVRVYDNALTAAQIQADMNTPIKGTQDTIPPTVSLTAPADGATVSGTVTVSANASDNVGVAEVQFLLDGNNLGAEGTVAPYSVSWDTTTATNGTHTLTARARDAAGNTTTSSAVTVTVSNVSGVSLTIDGAQTFQTVDGFGVNINSRSWKGGELKPALDMLNDQMGARLYRVVYDMEDWESTNDNADPNTPDWTYYNALYSNASFQQLWGTLHYLNQKGVSNGIILSFMGRVPTWMGGSVIDSSLEDEWVETITTLVSYARNTEHVQFAMLDPLNEPDWNGIEGPQVDAVQYTRLLNKLSAQLDALGLGDIRLLGPNTASIDTGVNAYMPTMMNDPVVMKKIDHFAFHNYAGYTAGADAAIKASAYPTKNFWITEVTNPWDIMEHIGGNPSAVMVWEGYDSAYIHPTLHGATMDPPNDAGNGPAPLAYDAATGLYTPRHSFYQDEQIFKYVPPASVRISANQSNANLTVYAFYHQATGRVTIVGQNTGTSDVTLAGLLSNLPALAGFQYYETDAGNNFLRLADVSVKNGSFAFIAPGNSFFTLTTLALPDTTPPSVSLTAPADGSTVTGTVTVSAAASDNVGVAGVQFLVNGNNLGVEDTASPYSMSWDTTKVANGSYTLAARARDAAGNTTVSTPVTVTVNNPFTKTVNVVPTFTTFQAGDGQVFGLDSSGTLWRYRFSDNSYTNSGFGGLAIAVSNQGDGNPANDIVFLLDTNHKLWYWNTTYWTSTGGYLPQIVAGDNQVFGVGYDNQVWQFNVQSGWRASGGYGAQTVVGSVGDNNSSNDVVFLKSIDGRIWVWTQTTWWYTGGYLKTIVGGDNHVFGVGYDNQVWRYRVSGPGAGWRASGGFGVDIVVGNTGDSNPNNDLVWLRDANNGIWLWTQSSWANLNQKLTALVAGDYQIFGLDPRGQLVRFLTGPAGGWKASGFTATKLSVASAMDDSAFDDVAFFLDAAGNSKTWKP